MFDNENPAKFEQYIYSEQFSDNKRCKTELDNDISVSSSELVFVFIFLLFILRIHALLIK